MNSNKIEIGTEVYIRPIRLTEKEVPMSGLVGIVKYCNQIAMNLYTYILDVDGMEYTFDNQTFDIKVHKVDRKTVHSIMQSQGFTLYSYSSDHSKRQYIDSNNISCTINLCNNEFSLISSVPKSIATINIGSCSPFFDLPTQDKEYHQFNKMYNQMLAIVSTLKENLL